MGIVCKEITDLKRNDVFNINGAKKETPVKERWFLVFVIGKQNFLKSFYVRIFKKLINFSCLPKVEATGKVSVYSLKIFFICSKLRI